MNFEIISVIISVVCIARVERNKERAGDWPNIRDTVR